MKKQFVKYSLKEIPSEKYGYLMHPVELKDYIPFTVKRIYFITNPSKGITGEHCHYIEEEMFFLLQGTGVAVIDRGNGREEIRMQSPTDALYIPNFVWHGFKNISHDAILLALSSTNYRPDRSDYLEDYDEYLKIRDKKLSENAAFEG